jgi:hypothetical protein
LCRRPSSLHTARWCWGGTLRRWRTCWQQRPQTWLPDRRDGGLSTDAERKARSIARAMRLAMGLPRAREQRRRRTICWRRMPRGARSARVSWMWSCAICRSASAAWRARHCPACTGTRWCGPGRPSTRACSSSSSSIRRMLRRVRHLARIYAPQCLPSQTSRTCWALPLGADIRYDFLVPRARSHDRRNR